MDIRTPKGRYFFWGVLALACAILPTISVAATTEIVHNGRPDQSEEVLALQILKLALANDPKGGEYVYRPLDEALNEARLMQMLKDGDISVMWAGTQDVYEQELRPIHIPIFKGLLGHRIFLIRKGDQARFDAVKTLDDLKKIPLVQGRDWGDTAILQHSGFNVITAVRYENLFDMLDGGRADYFPRAVHEPWEEIEANPEVKLDVEENILLVYPFAMFFYVAKGDEKLAEAIERGFLAAIENGSYNELFFNHPETSTALNNAQLQKRKVFRIPNPNMTDDKLLDRPEFWLDIDSLK